MEDDALSQLDWLVARCSFESRGDAIRTAVAELVRRQEAIDIDRQIVDGYTRVPPTPDEDAWSAGGGFPGLPRDEWSDYDSSPR